MNTNLQHQMPSPLFIILPGTIGFFIGIGIILYDAYETSASREFVQSPGFPAWLLLISFVPALSGIFLFPVLQSFKQLKFQPGVNWLEIGLFMLAVVILMALPLLLPAIIDISTLPVRPLTYHGTKILLITIISYVVGLPCVLGIYVINGKLFELMAFDRQDKEEQIIDQYLQLRSHLQRFLTALGSLIGASTLATGMLRNVILSLPDTSPEQFPAESVLAFGGYYTLFVAVVYVPVFVTLNIVGRNLCDKIFPLPEPHNENWSDMYDKRSKLETLLHIQSSSMGNFTDSFIIAAPLIGSAISLLLG